MMNTIDKKKVEWTEVSQEAFEDTEKAIER